MKVYFHFFRATQLGAERYNLINCFKASGILTYFPSKKFILKILFIALALSAVFWFIFNKEVKKNKKDSLIYQKQNAPNQLNQFLDKDSDNDGLKDWEEILWKTDPRNSDTDKDGTPDGEEVKQNRDPSKPGPDDEFPADSSKLSLEQQENETLTQKVGREFIVQYLTMRGLENLGAGQKESLVNSMLEKLSAPTENKYSQKDVKISADNSPENIKNYVNNLANPFRNFKSIEKGEIQIMAEIISNEAEEDPEKIKQLQKNEALYGKTALEILNIRSPQNYQNIHLGFLNNFDAIADAIAKMELIYEDPAQAIVGLQIYFAEAAVNVNVFKDFKTRFNKDKIKIAPNEEGYIFVKDYFPNI